MANVEFFDRTEENLITLFDDEGNEVQFYEIACVEYEDALYALLQPAEEVDGIEEDEVAIFKIEEEDEETDQLIPVEDEELLNAVFEEYVRAVSDEEDCD